MFPVGDILLDPLMVPDTRDTFTIVSKIFLDFIKSRKYEDFNKNLFWMPRLCIKDVGIKVKFELHQVLFDLHFIPTVNVFTSANRILRSNLCQISYYQNIKMLKARILHLINK